jgi:hypothetical protein
MTKNESCFDENEEEEELSYMDPNGVKFHSL